MEPLFIKRRMRMVLGPLIGAGAVFYFGYHTIQGDRGLMAWWQLRHEIAESELLLVQSAEARLRLEHRVNLLRPDSLDPDLLEERARAMFNLGHDSEIVILEKAR